MALHAGRLGFFSMRFGLWRMVDDDDEIMKCRGGVLKAIVHKRIVQLAPSDKFS